ncbi:hypothetical protein K450DRAFT_254496 [Umbelopsis ramanniana AG]|uniref:BZIP domain-containing protein n=1 Tax=Umbelopsis ramanniana AG TaxID=1314678 RepID=A0AAD5HAD5_UMBRA|nr:uncharacterized protein K450DRAFT_254496 [Umbelopsis ramanniana AG]KAI8576975.1 hypothetical protein K450DRAFT_254496 [Umbelopsis ramanniana AG]
MVRRSARNNTSTDTVTLSTVAKPTEQNAATLDEAVKSPDLPVTTKLDQEPNPFEQSFSGASSRSNNQEAEGAKAAPKLVLPPAASIASPSPNVLSKGIFPKDMAEQFAWDSLRSGPLSPSMLQRPADSTFSAVDGEQLGTNNRIGSISNVPGAFSFQGMTPNSLYGTSTNPQQPAAQYQDMNGNLFTSNTMPGQAASDMYMMQRQNMMNMGMAGMDQNNYGQSTSPPHKRARRKTLDDTTEDSTSQTSEQSHSNTNKSRRKASKDTDDDERRKNFLERNRQAALKCRQRKKQWLNNLQAKVEYLTNDNEQLQLQANALREEIINLKTLLIAHKDCAVAQQNGMVGLNLLQQQRPPPAGTNAMAMSMAPTAPLNAAPGAMRY